MSTRAGGNRGSAARVAESRKRFVGNATTAANARAHKTLTSAGVAHSPALHAALESSERELATYNAREVARVYGADGRQMLERAGVGRYKDSSVTFPDAELAQMPGATFTHNHPRGTSFSEDDGRFAATHQLAEMRAVGTSYRYSMTPPPGGWSERTWREVIEPSYRKHDRAVQAEFRAAIFARTMTPKRAEATHAHEVWTRVARETGVGYRRSSWHLNRGAAAGEG